MQQDSYFTSDLFQFLLELQQHNERDWFQRNKARYEAVVREPFLQFIAELGPRLKKINPELVADPRPVGGSMMRIHRDIRFSSDKSPYKTFIAAHFGHARGRAGATPAYYLHFEPSRSFIGAGMWRPEPGALKRIRDAIVADGKHWQRVTSGAEFRASCSLAGESLKRAPMGYDPAHPLIEAIKRKDFTTSSPLGDRQVWGMDLMRLVVRVFRASAPFIEFLERAIGLPG